MKTLEEQRKEAEENYASRGCDGDCALCPEICHKSSDRMAFHAGWEAATKELACWHDPKKELPETDVEVLVKIDTLHNKYDIMKHNEYGWWQKAPVGGWCAPNHEPIGWRHIHEI